MYIKCSAWDLAQIQYSTHRWHKREINNYTDIAEKGEVTFNQVNQNKPCKRTSTRNDDKH